MSVFRRSATLRPKVDKTLQNDKTGKGHSVDQTEITPLVANRTMRTYARLRCADKILGFSIFEVFGKSPHPSSVDLPRGFLRIYPAYFVLQFQTALLKDRSNKPRDGLNRFGRHIAPCDALNHRLTLCGETTRPLRCMSRAASLNVL